MLDREVKLPSGALLKIDAATFEESKDLHQALLREVAHIPINASATGGVDLVNPVKQVVCIGLSSPVVEACLWKCLAHCTYSPEGNSVGSKITKDTFKSLTAREDYIDVCLEVALENLLPFVKALYARFKPFFPSVTEVQA